MKDIVILSAVYGPLIVFAGLDRWAANQELKAIERYLASKRDLREQNSETK